MGLSQKRETHSRNSARLHGSTGLLLLGASRCARWHSPCPAWETSEGQHSLFKKGKVDNVDDCLERNPDRKQLR